MRTEQWGGLTVRIAGGTDRRGGGEGPVVVLMHGFGASGEDLVPLHRVLDVGRATRFVFPEAPHRLDPRFGGDGRMWWMIDPERLAMAMQTGRPRDLSVEEPPGVDEAREAVRAMLAALRSELGVTGPEIALGGFSQGSMLACDVAFRSEEEIGALVVLSGALLMESKWSPGMPARAGLPVFQSHGTDDTVLGYDGAERLASRMKDAGLSSAFHSFRGGHEIPPMVLTRMQAFLNGVFATEE
jgi:phospholipase/carboxylesterase